MGVTESITRNHLQNDRREMICINTSTLPDQMRDLTTAWQYPAGYGRTGHGKTAVDARDPAVDRDLGWHWPAAELASWSLEHWISW